MNEAKNGIPGPEADWNFYTSAMPRQDGVDKSKVPIILDNNFKKKVVAIYREVPFKTRRKKIKTRPGSESVNPWTEVDRQETQEDRAPSYLKVTTALYTN